MACAPEPAGASSACWITRPFPLVPERLLRRFVQGGSRDRLLQQAAGGFSWQAAVRPAELLQLKVGRLGGYVDRQQLLRRRLNDTLLGKPGGGDLSSGLQRVADRPFGISEWIQRLSLALQRGRARDLRRFGLGLQGWDASYEFTSKQIASSFTIPSATCLLEYGNVDVADPDRAVPALARMIMRGRRPGRRCHRRA